MRDNTITRWCNFLRATPAARLCDSGFGLEVENEAEMWPGNTADVKTLLPVVKRMRQRFSLREITVVADRGMVSQATLKAFEESDPPVRYIIGVRMRRQKELALRFYGAEHGGLRAFQSAAARRIPHR
jgi:Transposase DDE domain